MSELIYKVTEEHDGMLIVDISNVRAGKEKPFPIGRPQAGTEVNVLACSIDEFEKWVPCQGHMIDREGDEFYYSRIWLEKEKLEYVSGEIGVK